MTPTPRHLQIVAGKRDKLTGRIQETCGISKDEADKHRDRSMHSMRAGQDSVPTAQFCDDPTLLDKIGGGMCNELDKGNAVVSIATGTHRRLLEKQLTVHGINIIAALSKGQYASLNARAALSTIIVDGVPDVIRFAEVVGALLDRTADNYRRVLIFGELVPLMHADGKHAGAEALETLWCSFVASRPMFLHCEYPTHAIHSYSSISFSHRASSRDIPRTWAVVGVEMNVGVTPKPLDANPVSIPSRVA